MKGIVHDGYYFQGKSFAQNMVKFGTANADAAFDQAVVNALNGRLGLSDSDNLTAVQIKDLVADAIASGNQLYYDASTGTYNNSLCWWGAPYVDANGDQQMQLRGFAADDSIEYIQSANIPEGAEYVCRSYYYYGTAGGTIEPVDDFLLMLVRVQTSIEDPYQQTVVVSIPASLLSVGRVLVTEKNANSNPSYVASVEQDTPMRIVYEVGLRSDINAQNVVNIVSDVYKNEVTADKSACSVDNFDAETDTYYFYTNDWDRSKTVESHERAMTRAGFDVASDNSFYTYEKDTKLYIKNSRNEYMPVTDSVQPGETYYYKRVYYDWEGTSQNADKTYNCVKKEAWVAVTAPSAEDLQNSVKKMDGEWYVKAGTSTIVSHPKRTNSLDDPHYTVYLGNNGRLALTADKAKTVDINAGTNGQILDADGNAVTVGDILTYKIKVVNNEGTTANAVVTDKVPVGTELVEGSIAFDENGTRAEGTGAENNGTITWNITGIPANGVVYVSFKAEVTATALQGAAGTLENTASVQIGNNPAYNTNTTENPPFGKVVAGENVNIGTTGEGAQGGIQVGQTLIYHIYWANAENTVSDVVITDIIPQGTNYVANSASDNGVYNDTAKTLTWTMKNVQPGTSGVVTFKVIVDATAKSPIENSAQVQIGENGPQVATNPTEVEVLKGNLELTKVVANGGTGYEDKVFTLELATAGSQMNTGYGLLNGSYAMTRSSSTTEETVVFTNGIATVQLKADEKLTIKELPAGLTLIVTEKNVPGGYTASYSATNGQISVTARNTSALTVTNTYAVNPIEFQMVGSKTLDTDDFFPETTFTAIVERCTVDAATGEWTTTGETATTAQTKVSSANKTGEFVFARRTFTQADIGDHYYLITEFNNHLTGVDYDETQYRMKLVVADNGSGQLTITTTIWEKAEGEQEFVKVSYAESLDNGVIVVSGVEFTNTYQPVETAVTLTGTKTLANRTLAANEFGFEVIEVVNGVVQESNVSTGQNKADGSIEFRPITYHKAGTHTYIIREVDGKLANVAYDKTVYTVTVNVTDKDGSLEAAVVYNTTDGKAPVFGNVYAPGDASIVLIGTKALTGRELVDKEFTFEVLDAAGKVVSTGQNVGTGNDNIVFTPITIKHDTGKQGSYTETLTYTVKEAIPTGGAKDPYMGYDTTEFTIKVDVKYDAETGLLTATAQTGNPAIAFTNEQYPSSVAVTPTGSKTTTVPDGSTANLPDNKDGTIIAELSNADGTVTFNGTDTGITFKNIYKATEGTSATMDVAKELSGRNQADGEFTFELWYVDGASESLVTTTTNQGGKVSFTRNYLPEAVKFEDGSLNVEYTYIIREQAGNLPGVTYATNEIGVKVVIYNNTELGKLELAGVTYYQCENGVFGDQITDTSLLKFVNTYQSEGTSIIPEATKVLNNRTMKDDEFSFEVRSLDGNNNVSEKPVSVGLSKADGRVVFTPIGYSDREGTGSVTNRYVISEVKGNLGGITYSEAKYYMKVVVTDEGIGELKAVGTYHTDIACESTPINAADVKFVNTYSTAVGTAQLQADKVLTGRDMIANEFDFVVKAAGTDTVVAYGDNTAAKAGQAAGITFTTLSYSLADMQGAVNGVKTFEYTISEVKPIKGHLNGITIDEAAYTAKVTVTDNGVGMLIVDPIKYYDKEGNEISKPVFTNVYKPAETDIILNATKVLKEKKLLENEFFFVLKDSAGNIVKDASGKDIKVTNDANGQVIFPAITFGAAGDYTYYVEEVKSVNTSVITDESMQDNYYFDPVSYKVIVTVTDDKAGQLHASAIYFNADTEVQNMVFANLYTPDQVTIDLSTAIDAVKKVVDQDNNVIGAYPLSGFEFVVTDIYGNEVTEGTSGVDGKITFVDFTFSQADEYRYKISERLSGKPGITDDTRQWELHIHVKHNPDGDDVKDVYGDSVEIGKLYVAELAVYAETVEEAAPEFVNTYKAAPASLTIVAEKQLSGRPLKANEFTFRLMEGDLILAEAQNDADGNVTFRIDVNAAGKHVYTIREITPEKQNAHIHYDNKVISVEVTAVEDYSGQLKIQGANEFTVVSQETFRNIYTPSPVSVNVTAKKVLNGAALQAGAFEFELVDESGAVVRKMTNNSAGNVEFDELVFTKLDLMGAAEITRTYTIREVNGNDSNITYDETEYAVKITVTDDMAGQLHANITYDTTDGTLPVFTNTYTKPADSQILVQLEGTKALLGGSMTDGQFKFEIHDSNGILCNTGINRADGTIDFYEMAMTQGIHVLTVSEVNDGQKGIVYDSRKFEVVVNVYDHYGTLRAEVCYPEGGIAFVNRTGGYVAPTTGDSSPILLLLAALVVCGGGLSGLLFWKKKKEKK